MTVQNEIIQLTLPSGLNPVATQEGRKGCQKKIELKLGKRIQNVHR